MHRESTPSEEVNPDHNEHKQYEQVKSSIELNGGTVRVVEMLPTEKKSEVPTVIAPGWVANARVFEKNLEALAGRGRHAIALENLHGIKPDGGYEELSEYPNAELRKVAALMAMIEEKKLPQVDAIAHSEGGIYLIIAATLYPEKFRNLILVNPAGMLGDDNVLNLAVRFSKDVVAQTVAAVRRLSYLKPILRINQQAGKALMTGPVQAVKQIFAISNTQIHEMLAELEERGVHISLIHTMRDKAFPIDRVKEHSKQGIKHFYTRTGTHNQLTLEPERYTAIAERALTLLEKERGEENK